MRKKLPKKYRTTKEESDKIIQKALAFKEIHGYAFLIIERHSQLVYTYETLWACQMRSRQSIAVHQLPYDYFIIKDVDDFLNNTGESWD